MPQHATNRHTDPQHTGSQHADSQRTDSQHAVDAGPAHADHAHTRPRGWWRDAVIYQVYVRSFADSDGDGVGDLPGVRQRLPHLAGLGVDALWLTPFYASPQIDGGYDVSDYRAVDPRSGSLDDARQLVSEAHTLGLRVLLDLVPNHTSDAHPWFRRALAGDAGARACYHFVRGRGTAGQEPPNDWESLFGGPAWSRVPGEEGLWYLHLFSAHQPDLDWRAPRVHEEFDSVLRFWLDTGVDGFRIDVAHGMVKAEGLPDVGAGEQARMIGTRVLPFFDQDGVHAIHRAWRRLLESYGPDRICVAEAWAPTAERLARYVRPDECHQAFNLHFLQAGWDAEEVRRVIEESMAAATTVGAPTTWVLSNHDVVRHRTRLGSLARARAAALLMLALPGSAYLYQGEELGLPEVRDLPDEARRDPAFSRGAEGAVTDGQEGMRDGCRVPMPWTAEGPSLGFGPDGGWLPQPEEWRSLSVEAQTGDPLSTLELYRTALRLRRLRPGLGDSAMEWLTAPEGVLALSRPGLVCVLNTRDEAVEAAAPGELLLCSAPGESRESMEAGAGAGRLRIPANSCTWWAA
ncbi:glycoside hydrolase family 13 protein [Streptomyces tubbatahanensis]|uniref:Glycoside hydrolase family 13 protein n=1 Tax=Streptomyces tubbatahanensis TaxID=2923272 RepID=A0ABY3XQK8_9ACTN|nr:glycoside hydrolase family 13 protein [Streptomyces tubbatahanensis]UNS96690.1 glycoside hydrolase family 13 protein [Streptomyces tubbatahanensis]